MSWAPRAGAVTANGDAGRDRLDCAGCHAARDPHQRRFGEACASCHAVETCEIASFQHPSPDSRQCVECHRAPPSHYMMHFRMVSQRVAHRQAPVEQCYACHTTDGWNNIRRVGIYDHH
jgi:hypothetical protein